jgi:hypothetical protein
MTTATTPTLRLTRIISLIATSLPSWPVCCACDRAWEQGVCRNGRRAKVTMFSAADRPAPDRRDEITG